MSVGHLFRLIGFGVGAFLHVYLIGVILRQEIRGVFRRALLLLVSSLGAWHLGNALQMLLELSSFAVSGSLKRGFELLAYTGLGILPSALMITYLEFPAYRRGERSLLPQAHAFPSPAKDGTWRTLRAWRFKRFFFHEPPRTPSPPRSPGQFLLKANKAVDLLLLSPVLFLPLALRQLVVRVEAAPMDRLKEYLLPFIVWLAIAMLSAAALSLKLSRTVERPSEKQLFRWLARIFGLISAGLVLVYLFRLRELPVVGDFLETLQMLSSIAPTSLVAYHIYRYNYLDLVIRRRLVYGLQIAVLLMLYFAGIRQLSGYLGSAYGLAPQITESLLIAALLAISFPISVWIDRFVMGRVREYREFVTQLNDQANSILELAGRVKYIEDAVRNRFEFRRATLVILGDGKDQQAGLPDADLLTDSGTGLELPLLARLAGRLIRTEGAIFSLHRLPDLEIRELMEQLSCNHLLALKFERRLMGYLLVDSYPLRELGELEDLLLALSGQIAACIAAGRLLETKLRLEREMARQEQLVGLGRMAATMAHEVRNPLGSIKTLVQLMREDRELAGRRAEELELINAQIDRLNRTVTQLLSFSRPQRQKPDGQPGEQPDLEAIYLEDLLQSVALVASGSGGQAEQCRFEIALPPDLPRLAMDSSLLQEIFLNLFLNALQAGPGPRLVRVNGTLAPSGGAQRCHLTLEIFDDGPGIPEEVQSHIFEAFYTTRQRGTGLGLYIVKRNVEALGGKLTFKSPAAAQGGTLFTITLPV